MMMDADMVAASPGSVYRVLSQAGALRCWEAKPGKKGKGFVPRFGWLTDHGPQFVAKDFKACSRVKGMGHVRTSPYYPQSNGKLARWHKRPRLNSGRSLKSECIRPKMPLNLDEARRLVSACVDHYNRHRPHSAIGTIAPADKLAGRAPEMLENRARKLSKARAQRAENRRLQSERPVRVSLNHEPEKSSSC